MPTFEFTNDLIFTAYNENMKIIYEERHEHDEEDKPLDNIFSFISEKVKAIFANLPKATLIQLSIDCYDETVFANIYRS